MVERIAIGIVLSSEIDIWICIYVVIEPIEINMKYCLEFDLVYILVVEGHIQLASVSHYTPLQSR